MDRQFIGHNGTEALVRFAVGLPGRWPGDLRGGVMRIGRAIIIPAIAALGMAGSVLIGSAMPAAAASVPNATGQVLYIQPGTDMFHHG
jgi:hypothetical protein